MLEIENKQKEMRDLVNKPIIKRIIDKERNGIKSELLYSALDMLEDTELGINEYLKIESGNPGQNYLYIFGVLQALYVQSDVIKYLKESLGLKMEFSKNMKRMREIRNNAVGHPTNRTRNKGKTVSHNYIIRMSLTHKTFEIHLVHQEERKTEETYVDLHELINTHHMEILEIIGEICAYLTNCEKEYKTIHQNDLLSNCFPSSLDYHIRKINEVINTDRNLAQNNFTQVYNSFVDFNTIKEKRDDIKDNEPINSLIAEIEFPITKLYNYFNEEIGLEEAEIDIYCFYLDHKFRELVEIAKEIDDEMVL